MDFIIQWLIFSGAILFALAIDNLYWVPRLKKVEDFVFKLTGKTIVTGSPEWVTLWPKLNTQERIWWLFRKRFIQVIVNPLDISAALTGGLILAFIL